MLKKQEVKGSWRGAGHRLRAWAWETDHDDTVPTVLAWLVLPAFVVLVVAAHVSTWAAVAMILAPPAAVALLMYGRSEVRAAQQTVDDIRRQLSSSPTARQRIDR